MFYQVATIHHTFPGKTKAAWLAAAPLDGNKKLTIQIGVININIITPLLIQLNS